MEEKETLLKEDFEIELAPEESKNEESTEWWKSLKSDNVKKWEKKTMRASLTKPNPMLEASRKSRETVNREAKEKQLGPAQFKTTFDSILKEMKALHYKKNTDYGDAWHEEFQEFGPICGVLRLYEKVKRLASIYKNGKVEVNDESFEDTLIDIANYAVMTLNEYRNMKKS